MEVNGSIIGLLEPAHSCNEQFALTLVEMVHIQSLWLASSYHRLERCVRPEEKIVFVLNTVPTLY